MGLILERRACVPVCADFYFPIHGRRGGLRLRTSGGKYPFLFVFIYLAFF